MRTLVYQRPGMLNVANNGSVRLVSPQVRPSIQGRAGLQGVAREAIVAARPVVLFNIVPTNILDQFEATLQTRRYAIQGGWDSADWQNDFDTQSIDVSGVLFLQRGIIEHDAEFDGIFEDQMLLTNRSGGVVTINYMVTVFSKLNEDAP